MKNQVSLRFIALCLSASILSADGLEAASNLVFNSLERPSEKQSATKQSAARNTKSSAKSASFKTVPKSSTATKSATKRSSSRTSANRTTTSKPSASKTATSKSSSSKSSSSKSRAKSTKKYAATSRKYSSKKQYSSRYRSSRSSKKYASRYYGKKRSRKYYSRYHRRSKSSRYASSRRSSESTIPTKTFKSFAETWHETLRDEELMPGVRYKHYIISTGSKHSIHVLEVDRTKPDVAIGAWKANSSVTGLETLSSLAQKADSGKGGILQGMVNANFYRSAFNTPLGHAVVNGEVVEMSQYKGWTSCFFDRQNRMYMERFTVTASLRTREASFPIETVNSRMNANGVVLYNRYAGSTVPMQPPVFVDNLEASTGGATTNGTPTNGATINGEAANPPSKSSKNKQTSLSTAPVEEAVSQSQIQRTRDIQFRMAAAERPLYKATLLYASQPMINEEVTCRVVQIDTGAVEMPQNGVVISFGRNIDESELPRPGDKVTLMFKTNVYSGVPFVHAVCGTPRLVRSGIARHEATQESSTGRNFVSQKLPRTAIGANANGTTLYFVTTDPTDTEAGTTGMTLQELAEGMRQIGAYNAINLDGGSSASMVVRGDVNTTIGTPHPVSLALGIIQQDPNSERSFAPKRRLITKPSLKPSGKSDNSQGTPNGTPNGAPQGQPRQEGGAAASNEVGQKLNMQEFKPDERK